MITSPPKPTFAVVCCEVVGQSIAQSILFHSTEKSLCVKYLQHLCKEIFADADAIVSVETVTDDIRRVYNICEVPSVVRNPFLIY